MQKCDPDKCDENSRKNRLCFFTLQAFPSFIPSAVTWGPNLDPCSKSVVLTGAIKIHIKFVYVIFTPQTFAIFILLVVTWGPDFGVCGKSVILTGAIKIHIKVVYAFLPSRRYSF